MPIDMRPVTAENWRAVTRLELAEGQQDFVAPNTYSLAQAAYERNLTPLALYDEDTLVGFVMYTHAPHEGEFWILRVMLARDYQNKGYGRQAMEALIARMRQIPGCGAIHLDFAKTNAVARRLYESLGFVVYDENEHEYIAKLDLPDAAPEVPARPGVVSVRTGVAIDAKQAIDYFVGISENTVGATGISLQLVTIPPGGAAKAHLHQGYETAIYVLSGRAATFYGPQLADSITNGPGEFIYIAPDVLHQPRNLSDTEPVVALVARNDANEQEHVILAEDL